MQCIALPAPHWILPKYYLKNLSTDLLRRDTESGTPCISLPSADQGSATLCVCAAVSSIADIP